MAILKAKLHYPVLLLLSLLAAACNKECGSVIPETIEFIVSPARAIDIILFFIII